MEKNYKDSFSERIKRVLKSVPQGKVATYGQIAAYAGNLRAARQVAWLLHSSSNKYNLPWHRIINNNGRISLKPGQGYEIQKVLLEREGVIFDKNDVIDLRKYLWRE